MGNDREHAPERIRAFVAIRLSTATIEAIGAMVAKVKELGADVAWIKPANFHLTLRFLGDQVSVERIEPLKAALTLVARETASFAIAARGIGAFPDWHGARVVWVGLESAELMTLAARVEASAVAAGFEREHRPYTAHLTVGRVRGFRRWRETQRALKEWSAHDFGGSQIESMTLYRSILSPGGSQYLPLAEFRFG
ncbi:MAG TPA: RNA 2',3'-cyclic phosphodiesterase [Candidatus Binataceae bacterium]|nr:RNA 2',3'-cyclic phosphodiesterase [Candidatus Binataceae bacterium]